MGIFTDWIMVSDIDGTLIGDDCVLHDVDIKAVSDYIKEGGTFVLATGRSADSAQRFYEQLHLSTPIIVNNGTLIRDFSKGIPIYADVLEDNASALVEYVLDSFPEAGVEIYGTDDIYFLRHNQMVKEHVEREGLTVINQNVHSAPRPWCKILFAIDPPIMNRFRAFIERSCFSDQFFFSQSAPFFFEASKLGASKGKAVHHLVQKLGLSTKKLITIGDNENDAKMLELAHVSFAVGNATEYAKKAAKYQTNAFGSTGGAVAEAIETVKRLILQEK